MAWIDDEVLPWHFMRGDDLNDLVTRPCGHVHTQRTTKGECRAQSASRGVGVRLPKPILDDKMRAELAGREVEE